jgi:hypothetical protein
LTTERLRSQPHKVSFDGGESLSLPLPDIGAVTAGGRMFQTLVSLRGGGQEKFVVYKRAAWLADIARARPGEMALQTLKRNSTTSPSRMT